MLRSPWVVGGGIGPVVGVHWPRTGDGMPHPHHLTLLNFSHTTSYPSRRWLFCEQPLIDGAICVVNGPYRPQHPDMCLQRNPFRTLPPTQDATSNLER